MSDATLIYPHQLFHESPAIAKGRRIYLIEEPLLLTHNPIHRSKLVLHKLSMDAYQTQLAQRGHDVIRLKIQHYPSTDAVFQRLRSDGVTCIHVVDTTDDYLERALAKSGLERIWYDSPLFLLSKAEAEDRFLKSKRFMASFYKQLRRDTQILLEQNGGPVGGKWSFDEENRKKIPKKAELPGDIIPYANEAVTTAANWANSLQAETYGDAVCWLPYTHEQAAAFMQTFLHDRFDQFGTYEDAMTTRGVRLWHSTLSPLLNIGLLTPKQVIKAALDHAAKYQTPLNSLEGFIRQILGWREFVRASYETDGAVMRSRNFWQHTRPLPARFWSGETGLLPVDTGIRSALAFGYNHHIERLMVMGNIVLLSQVRPHDVYRWFMGMYIDAYDWVMVPNVYGMSQFADGGSFATKPYISGANYIKKMSDYQRGDWETVWTGLYWNFIHTHRTVFEKNHRLAMMPRLLDRMPEDTRTRHFDVANAYLADLI